jgi:hypothetical protein
MEGYFMPVGDIIFYFSVGYGSLANKLNFPAIDYLARIRSIVLKAWGGFERSTTKGVIGNVLGTDIIDEVQIFKRSERRRRDGDS